MPRFLRYTQHGGHRQWHVPRIRQCREFHEPNAIGILVHDARRELQRQAGLANPAYPHERQEAGPPQQFLDFRQFAFAPNERSQLLRQVVRCRFERAQCREVSPELRMQQLVDVLGTR